MKTATRQLWQEQDRHPEDRERLFQAVGATLAANSVLYPGSFVDIAASFVFPSVTYVDIDDRAARFFADVEGVEEIVTEHREAPQDPAIRFLHRDYTEPLGLADESFDLLVSLSAGFVSEHCTPHLRLGGTLLVNSSHGDAAMASIDPRYRLQAVVLSRSGGYKVSTAERDAYLVPASSAKVSAESLHRTGRGVKYTRSPAGYLFKRVR